LPFESPKGDQKTLDWGKSIQNLYVSELTGVEGIGVLDPTSVDGYLEGVFGTPSPDRGVQLSNSLRTAGATMVIDGTIMAARDGYRVQSRLVDAASGEIKYARDDVAGSEEALASVVGKSSEKILDFFQVTVLQLEKDKDIRPWLSQRK